MPTLIGSIYDPGTAGLVLTSAGAGLTPTFQALSNTVFGPTFSIQGFNQAVSTSGAVIGLDVTAYTSPEKACAIYNMVFSIACTTGSIAVSMQPYGNATGGVGNLIGTAKNITATTTMTYYTQTQTVAISPGGYYGIGLTPASAGTFLVNVQLWTTQTGV